jgi:hypothetical protein
MKKFIISIMLLIFLIILNSNNIFAQELSHGKFGISAAANAAQADISLPIWAGNYNSIAPSIGIVNVEESYTDLSLALVYHHYFKYNKNFSPFLGIRGGALLNLPESGTKTTDYLLGIAGGGEYFFSSNFSVGIEAQLNFTFSDENSTRFGNPGGTNFNTGSVIFAAVYF